MIAVNHGAPAIIKPSSRIFLLIARKNLNINLHSEHRTATFAKSMLSIPVKHSYRNVGPQMTHGLFMHQCLKGYRNESRLIYDDFGCQ
jgi:hypothetical protein